MPHATSLRSLSACDALPVFHRTREYSRGVSRPTRADIDLDALHHNAAQIFSRLQPKAKLLAVLKADAYGHGAVLIARALTQETSREYSPECVAMLGVASVDEGAELREAGIEAPILLLSAILPEEAELALAFDLTPTIFSEELADACNEAAKTSGKVADFHFKIDTGMNRLGAPFREAPQLLEKLREYSHLHLSGVYTHFACADETDSQMTRVQAELFEKTLLQCGLIGQANADSRPLIHAANSAAVMRFSHLHFDLARAGIALYGIDPRDNGTSENALPENVAREYSLHPVMTLRSRVTHVKEIAAGETVSYGATWRAKTPTRLAIVPVGYADGYPRRASGRAQILIGGARCPVAGRITMDQIIVDCSHVPNVRVGDDAILFGAAHASTRESTRIAIAPSESESASETTAPCESVSQAEAISVAEVASWAQTIPYEVLCGIAPRVPRIPVREYSHRDEAEGGAA